MIGTSILTKRLPIRDFLTVNTMYKTDLFKGQKLPRCCRFYEKADEKRLKQLEKNSTVVKTEEFKKSTVLTDD